jgi:hypothetical protein
MTDAVQGPPELYRQAAQKLRELAAETPLADIEGDLLQLAARFERMASYFEAQRRLDAAREQDESNRRS